MKIFGEMFVNLKFLVPLFVNEHKAKVQFPLDLHCKLGDKNVIFYYDLSLSLSLG